MRLLCLLDPKLLGTLGLLAATFPVSSTNRALGIFAGWAL